MGGVSIFISILRPLISILWVQIGLFRGGGGRHLFFGHKLEFSRLKLVIFGHKLEILWVHIRYFSTNNWFPFSDCFPLMTHRGYCWCLFPYLLLTEAEEALSKTNMETNSFPPELYDVFFIFVILLIFSLLELMRYREMEEQLNTLSLRCCCCSIEGNNRRKRKKTMNPDMEMWLSILT